MNRNGQVRQITSLAIVAVGVYLCVLLAVPFLPPLTWALGLAVIMHPLQLRLERLLGNPSSASSALVGAAAIMVGAGLVLAGQQLLGEAAIGAAHVEELLRRWEFSELTRQSPRISAALEWIATWFDPADAVARLRDWLTVQSASVVRVSINQAISFVLTFYFLFFFLRDREQILTALSRLLPLEANAARAIVARIAETVHATVKGILAVAIVQGALGGAIFYVLGLPAPAFWGLVMGLLAIVPVLGAFVVWIPAAILLALQGDWLDAAALALWGGVVIAGIDNLIYPILVGTQLRLHTLVVFIGAVGGIIVFGAPGVVLGPVIIVATLAFIENVASPADDTSKQ